MFFLFVLDNGAAAVAFPCTQELAASRARIRPEARSANQRTFAAATLAPKPPRAHTMGCARAT